MSGTFEVIDYHRPLAPMHSAAGAAATAAWVLTAARECPCCRPWLKFGIVDQALRNLCWCAGWLQRIDVNAERWLWTRRIMRPVRCRDRCGCCRRADSALCGKAPSAFVGFADGVTMQRAGLLANEIIPLKMETCFEILGATPRVAARCRRTLSVRRHGDGPKSTQHRGCDVVGDPRLAVHLDCEARRAYTLFRNPA